MYGQTSCLKRNVLASSRSWKLKSTSTILHSLCSHPIHEKRTGATMSSVSDRESKFTRSVLPWLHPLMLISSTSGPKFSFVASQPYKIPPKSSSRQASPSSTATAERDATLEPRSKRPAAQAIKEYRSCQGPLLQGVGSWAQTQTRHDSKAAGASKGDGIKQGCHDSK
jgi:hypothetical protein